MGVTLRKMLVGIAVAACATFTVSTALATPIFVDNFSFETLPAGGLPNPCGTGCSFSQLTPIPGWANTGDSGQFQPGVQASNFTFFNSVPDGITVAYANAGIISQTVAPTVVHNTVYTLQVDQGQRNDLGAAGTIELVIGGTPILATGIAPSPGNFSTFTATYTGLPGDVGDPITIRLTSFSAQGDWDNVRLDATLVPEPSTLWLFGAGVAGLAVLWRRRKAAQGNIRNREMEGTVL